MHWRVEAMETKGEREQSQNGSELKMRLKRVRRRKHARSSPYDAVAFKVRLARVKGQFES
jgi:hypothetical protein